MKKALAVLGGLVCSCVVVLPVTTARADDLSVTNLHDVLVLDEAARLLRVTPDRLLALVTAEQIPARNIGGEWRFSRAALLEWLKGDRHGGLTGAPRSTVNSGVTTSPALSREGMHAVTGMGETASPASGRAAEAVPVGEKPSAKTAEEIALRDQGVLLKQGATTLELGLAYARSERDNFPVLRAEETAFSANLTARYGIGSDLQVTARLPAVHRRSTTQVATSPTTADEAKTSEQYVADPTVSLLGVGMRERVDRPTVVWSVDTVLPTGPGDSGLGAGVILTKSYDPAVIFAGLGYLYGFSVKPDEPRRQLATHNLRLTLGYTFAVNDTLALNNAFVVGYRSGETPDNSALRPSHESHLLQLGMTWMLGRGLFVEPSVAFALGGPAPDFSFALNIPYTF